MNEDDFDSIDIVMAKLKDLTSLSNSIRELINNMLDEDVKKLCFEWLYNTVYAMNEINKKG